MQDGFFWACSCVCVVLVDLSSYVSLYLWLLRWPFGLLLLLLFLLLLSQTPLCLLIETPVFSHVRLLLFSLLLVSLSTLVSPASAFSSSSFASSTTTTTACPGSPLLRTVGATTPPLSLAALSRHLLSSFLPWLPPFDVQIVTTSSSKRYLLHHRTGWIAVAAAALVQGQPCQVRAVLDKSGCQRPHA